MRWKQPAPVAEEVEMTTRRCVASILIAGYNLERSGFFNATANQLNIVGNLCHHLVLLPVPKPQTCLVVC